MDNSDIINYKLLANPYHLKEKKGGGSLDTEIFLLLNKKFPGLSIYEKDYSLLLKKIEFLLFETIILNIVDEIIDNIQSSIENECLL